MSTREDKVYVNDNHVDGGSQENAAKSEIVTPEGDNLWPFEFLESFRCSISSVSIYYAPELDIRGKINDHLNFSKAFVVHLLVFRYIMGLTHTPE